MRPLFTTKPVLLIAAVVLLVAGFAVGAALPWSALRGRTAAVVAPAAARDDHAGHGHEEHADHAGGDHVDLSPTARANLGLQTGRVRLSDYVRTLHIPGEVVEAPGYSTADIPARVAGVVTAIRVAPGQAVRPGDPLFELELTGEALAEAQSRLLDDVRQLETLDAELERLGPLAEGGSVAGKQRLQVEYDRRRIEGQRNTRVQELLVRGLNRAQIDRILTNRELIKSVTVTVPAFPERAATKGEPPGLSRRDEPAGSIRENAPRDSGDPDDWEYTVETINVHPGESVGPDESLARLARHTRLHVQGHAFERDVPAIAAVGDEPSIAVEFGAAGHGGIDGPVGAVGEEDVHGEVVEGLKILYLDNHVDPDTQTFSFYVPLQNEVLRDVIGENGRVFRSWRFKPGQRVHVRVPVERLEDRIVLPAGAVATDGSEAFVFRLAGRHTVEGEGPDGEHLYAEEYEPVPVVVAHRGKDAVVLAPGGAIKTGDVIARNRAYQLLLALKNATEGGGGHHGHEH